MSHICELDAAHTPQVVLGVKQPIKKEKIEEKSEIMSNLPSLPREFDVFATDCDLFLASFKR